MSKMNGRTRRKFYDIISRKSGDLCVICGIPASEKKLVIDHIDNDNSNNRLDNLQLLCKSCNYHKNPRQPVAACVQRESEAIRINHTKEPEFRDYVYERVLRGGWHSPRKLIDAGAEKIGMSPATTRRYLKKMISDEGALRVRHGIVEIKNENILLEILPESEFAKITAINNRLTEQGVRRISFRELYQ